MGISIKNEKVEALARRLAQKHGTGITEIIEVALEEKAKRDEEVELPLWERIKPLQERIAKLPKTGVRADRAFFNKMTGEEE